MEKTIAHGKDICPIEKLTSILSDPWSVLIVRDTLIAPRRFCELEVSLVGISTRTLTLKLHKLLDEEVLEHNDTYYTITKKGKKLQPIIDAMEHVGKKF